MTKSLITTTVKAGLAAVMGAGVIGVPASGLIGVPASAATGATAESQARPATRALACKRATGSPKGAPNADISVLYCWKGRRVTWKAYFYPRGTRIGLEATGLYKGAVYTKKSRARMLYDTTHGRFKRVDHAWFKACKVRDGKVFYACAPLR